MAEAMAEKAEIPTEETAQGTTEETAPQKIATEEKASDTTEETAPDTVATEEKAPDTTDETAPETIATEEQAPKTTEEKAPEEAPEVVKAKEDTSKLHWTDFYNEMSESIKYDVEIRPNRKLCIFEHKPTDIENPPILFFIHGSCARLGQFSNQISAFASQYHIVSFDRIGCGKSTKPKSSDAYSADNIFSDLCAIFETYILSKKETTVSDTDPTDAAEEKKQDKEELPASQPPIVLIGHSYGSSQALRLMHTYGNKTNNAIKGAILIGMPDLEAKPAFMMNIFHLPATVLDWMSPKMSEQFRSTAIHPKSDPKIAQIESTMLNPAYMFKAFYQNWEKISGKDLSGLLKSSNAVPILMIHGKEDGVVPLAGGQNNFELMKKSSDKVEMKVVDDTSHQVMQEKPDVMNQMMTDFLKKVLE